MLYELQYMMKDEDIVVVGIVIAILILLVIKISPTYINKRNDRYVISNPTISQQSSYIDMYFNEVTPEQFLRMRAMSVKNKKCSGYSMTGNLPGVYILHNITRDMYYVGQGKRVIDRVNAHFTGKGNGDVYADYKYGNAFTIKIIPLYNSGFRSLDELERCMIAKYNAFYNGYNKTKGNFKSNL